MNVKIDREIERMVDMASRLIEAWDGREGRFYCDWLEEDNFIINYEVHDETTVEYATETLYALGERAAKLLNARDFECRRTGKWECHSELNYWDEDGNMCDDDDENLSTVQVSVFRVV